MSEEKRKAILQALMEIGTQEGRLCKEMLEKEEASLEDALLFIVSHATDLRSQRIRNLNKLTYDTIQNLIFMGAWPQLSQIFKSLPKEMVRAVEQARDKGDFLKHVKLYAEQMGQFIEMSEMERTGLLEIHHSCERECSEHGLYHSGDGCHQCNLLMEGGRE
jgi:hypothetical protein